MTQQKSERNNNTKKTVVIVALLLALIALLCFGGYTFSKYVTSGNGTGTANVAKWGYSVNVDSSNLFGKNYKYDTGATTSTVTEDTASLTVSASGDYKLVAPGTTGSMTIKLNGTAEVASKLVFKVGDDCADVSLGVKKGEADMAYYNPIKWTLKKGDTVVTVDNVELKDMKWEDMAAKIVSVSENYTVNANVSDTYTLSWAWAFEDTATTVADLSVDELDTILGQAANNTTVTKTGYTFDTTKTTVKVTLTVSIEQVKEVNA